MYSNSSHMLSGQPTISSSLPRVLQTYLNKPKTDILAGKMPLERKTTRPLRRSSALTSFQGSLAWLGLRIMPQEKCKRNQFAGHLMSRPRDKINETGRLVSGRLVVRIVI